jgi:L-rhamnose mutarotase
VDGLIVARMSRRDQVRPDDVHTAFAVAILGIHRRDSNVENVRRVVLDSLVRRVQNQKNERRQPWWDFYNNRRRMTDSTNHRTTTSGASAFAVGFLSGMVTLGMAGTLLWQRQQQQKQQQQRQQQQPQDHSKREPSSSSSSSSSLSLPPPRRFGGAIQLLPEQYDLYTQLHDAVWDQVLERMSRSNIRNFTIYYHEETNTMFQHFEWIGHWYLKQNQNKVEYDDNNDDDDEATKFQQDMAAIATDPIVLQWWSYCEPCQRPFSQWRRTTTTTTTTITTPTKEEEEKVNDPLSVLVPPPLLPPSQGGQGGDWWAPLKCLTQCGHWAIAYSPMLRDPEWVPQNPHGKTSTASHPPVVITT